MKAISITENWVVELPDDDPVGIKVLLHIIHSNYELVPPIVNLQYLYKILVVSDKYDMTHLIRPWANAWFKPFAKVELGPSSYLLFRVAWGLGADDIFKQLAVKMCLECKLSPEGELLDARELPLPFQKNDPLEPPGLFGRSTQ
jgi:hypothetical protein